MKAVFIFFIFAMHSLFAFSLKDKFLEAEAGTYIVTEQNQMISLLHLHSKEENRLIFEEISIPHHKGKNLNWKEWAEKGAPGCTSWIFYEVDLECEKVAECYSFIRKAFLSTEEMSAFLVPLMTLHLNYLSEEKRLQTGPAAKPGQVGNRPWGPPQFFEGKKITGPSYDVYTAKWPVDKSDLSGKPIVLYFDKERKTFPFPYWMQLREGAIKFKMRALDSGSDLKSFQDKMPRRAPSFTSGVQKEGDHLALMLNCPTYYKELKIYAVDMTQNPHITHFVPFSEVRSGESVTLLIDQKIANAQFTPGHEYAWIIASESYEMALESPFRMVYSADK
ncbi:MAG: hypothetical protein HRU43_00970 [Simkaniaceae bacterium]|nr:hypothetical protein [Simkaniaceae bacterium]